jgi:hypothetical protein
MGRSALTNADHGARVMNWLKRLKMKLGTIQEIKDLGIHAAERIDALSILNAKLLLERIRERGVIENIRDAEFKVFSQFGDDGIIQYILHNVNVDEEIFVEFGVQNYTEANTRFLLMNNNWSGLVMESDQSDVEYILKDPISWKYDLTAVNALVTMDNINEILLEHGISSYPGLLSIDIDGNDYWVWKAISVIDPVVVIVEYNSVFGLEHAITVPYDPTFNRTEKHHSNLYWGASLRALMQVGKSKGYAFVGCNSAGNNAYFVRNDRLGGLKEVSAQLGYVESKFRESRDRNGQLTMLRGAARRKAIEHLPVFDVARNKMTSLVDLD